MNKKEKESWTDLKDFGLPFVKIQKLKELEESLKSNEESEEKGQTEKPLQATELRSKIRSQIPLRPVESTDLPEEETESISENTDEEKVVIPSDTTSSPQNDSTFNKKKSSNWLVYVIIIGLLLVSAIVWQLMKDKSEEMETVAESIVASNSPVLPESVPSVENPVSETPVESTEITDNQDSTNAIINSENPTATIPETGTTIESNVIESLTRIESGEGRPRYFIIVGSLTSERLALEKVPEYQARASELYLITPYEDSPNYRLAIGRYYSFTQANNALSEIKDDYTEELWILRY